MQQGGRLSTHSLRRRRSPPLGTAVHAWQRSHQRRPTHRAPPSPGRAQREATRRPHPPLCMAAPACRCLCQAGIHQAIEAKEGVEVKPEARATASITFQVSRRPGGGAGRAGGRGGGRTGRRVPAQAGGGGWGRPCLEHLHTRCLPTPRPPEPPNLPNSPKPPGPAPPQVFFAFYSKLSGMTGTARAAAAEFFESYKLKVPRGPAAP